MTSTILTLNSGSSSIKFALFRAEAALPRTLSGKIDRIGLADAELSVTDLATGNKDRRAVSAPDHGACVPSLVEALERHAGLSQLSAIGYRVVHGGPQFKEPHPVTPDLLAALRSISPYAPEHLPNAIVLMEAFSRRYPEVPQVACFDTAFHRAMPRVAKLLPIPRRYDAQGVQRYGFHGLSYTYLMQELERIAGTSAARGRVILAHLGNGASMAAVHNGQSLDTTMSFTPAAGLVMSTRSGDIDPGLIAYLARTEGMNPEQFYEMVHAKSGLLGVSETSSDVRDLLEREHTDVRAAEALALFCYQARKWIGALAAALGGLDTLVFSGGIGENSAVIRARLCEGLQFLGLDLDPAHNQASAPVISRDTSRATVRVIRTDEELLIAQLAYRLVSG